VLASSRLVPLGTLIVESSLSSLVIPFFRSLSSILFSYSVLASCLILSSKIAQLVSSLVILASFEACLASLSAFSFLSISVYLETHSRLILASLANISLEAVIALS
jgi:hypothetical protein